MKKIYLVEDSKEILRNFESVTSKYGFSVVDSQSCDECISVMVSSLRHGDFPALVVLDVDMPEIDGLRFVDELRRFDKYTPVLFMTEVSSSCGSIGFRESGEVGWINKSFDEESFGLIVRRYIGY